MREAARALRYALIDENYELAHDIEANMREMSEDVAEELIAESIPVTRQAVSRLANALVLRRRGSVDKRGRESNPSSSNGSSPAHSRRLPSKKIRRAGDKQPGDKQNNDSTSNLPPAPYDSSQDPFVYLGIQDQEAFNPRGKIRKKYKDQLKQLDPDFLLPKGGLMNFFTRDTLPVSERPPENAVKDWVFECGEADCDFTTRANRDFPAHYRWWHGVRTWISEEEKFKGFIITGINYEEKKWSGKAFMGDGEDLGGRMVNSKYTKKNTKNGETEDAVDTSALLREDEQDYTAIADELTDVEAGLEGTRNKVELIDAEVSEEEEEEEEEEDDDDFDNGNSGPVAANGSEDAGKEDKPGEELRDEKEDASDVV